MLLMSSIMFTVLPTPAPPNRPTLPPLANGQTRSITLMPVSSRSFEGDSSSKLGALWWIDPASFAWLIGPRFVDRGAEHVHDAAQRCRADRHRDRVAGVLHHHAAAQAVGGAERNGAHDAVAELLLHFERQSARAFASSAHRRPSASRRAGIRRRPPRRYTERYCLAIDASCSSDSSVRASCRIL